MNRADVTELQKRLTAAGFPCVVDGIEGPETRTQTIEWWVSSGRAVVDDSPSAALAALRALDVPTSIEERNARAAGRVPVLDARDAYTGKTYPARSWNTVDTVCLHQMAAKGSIGWRRWTGLAAHWAVCCDGVAAWLIDFDRRVPHAHGWNARSVGFEIEGHYAGVEGDPKTHWVPAGATGERAVPMVLGGPVIEAALDAIRFTVARVAEHGGKVRYMVAHRQSYGVKASDPGEAIWKQIALFAMAEHGLVGLDPVGTGKPIPEAWGGAKGVPYR